VRSELEKHLGEEISVFTVLTDSTAEDMGLQMGTLRRLSDTALELRRHDGNLSYVAYQQIVRFVARPPVGPR